MKNKIIARILLVIFCFTAFSIPSRIGVKAEGLTAATADVTGEQFVVTIDVTSKKYGAKSGKDSTEAIQKALDKAAKKATATKRAMVYIPDGTYYISKTLRIDSNIYLKCGAQANIVEKGTKCLFMLRSAENEKGKYKNVQNITVEGGIWDAKFNKFNKVSGGSLFFFVHAKNINIFNAELKNNFGTHLIELGAVDGVTITGCRLHGFKKSSTGNDKEAIQLDIAKNYEVLPDAKPYDDTPCKNVTITNNEIYDYPRGIGSHTSVKGIYYNNIMINNNNIHDVSAEAIYAFNYTNLTVDSNVIKRSGAGVVFKSFSPESPKNLYSRKKGVSATKLDNYNYNVVIQNNSITTKNRTIEQSATTIGVFIYGTKTYPIKGCTVINNDIKSASSGVYYKYVGNSSFSNNRINRLNGSWGAGKNASFVVDAIKLLNSSNNSILNNMIYLNGSYYYENGIALRDSAKNNLIDGNQIAKVKKNGIGVYFSSSATISNNQVNSAGMHGITSADSSNATISANTIAASAKYGISVSTKSSATVSGNTVTGSGNHGISASTNSTISLSNNTISGNAGTGINVSDGVVPTLTNNKITNNKGKGIGLLNVTAPSVTGNTLSNPLAVWEITSDNSKTGLILMSPVSINTVAAGSTVVTGNARKDTQVVIALGGVEYTSNSVKGIYAITIPAQQAGTVITVISKDGIGNEAYSTTVVQ